MSNKSDSQKSNIILSKVSLEISFGWDDENRKKIDEPINFHFKDEKGIDIFTRLTKEQLLLLIKVH